MDKDKSADSPIYCPAKLLLELVELTGIEPVTSWMPFTRTPGAPTRWRPQELRRLACRRIDYVVTPSTRRDPRVAV